MNKYQILTALIVLTIAGFGCDKEESVELREPVPDAGVLLTVTHPEKPFGLGEPIEIDVTFTNLTDTALTVAFCPETYFTESVSVATDSKVFKRDETSVSVKRISGPPKGFDSPATVVEKSITKKLRKAWIELSPKGKYTTFFDLKDVALFSPREDLDTPGRFVVSVLCSSWTKRVRPHETEPRQIRSLTSNEILIEVVEKE